MKKNILYLAIACLTLGFTACSDDPNDAVSKHVYGENEATYLRTDASATISIAAEFRKGHVVSKTIHLKDYAETIQTKMKMTVDDMIAGLETGKVVLYNINTTKGVWNNTAPNNGTSGWYYDSNGNITTADKEAASIVFDKTNKALILEVPENSVAGVSLNTNIGFAVVNDKDYDQYVRLNVSFSVTDPGTIIKDISIPTGDYSSYELKFSDCESAISACFGMTVSAFNTAVQDATGDIAMYPVDDAGKWNTSTSYTANGIGYWCTGNGTVQNWGAGCAYFIETHDGTVGVGRYAGIASGSKYKVHFVYASKTDASKFIEFVLNVVME